MKLLKKWVTALLVAAGLAAIAAAVGFVAQGISARPQPRGLEVRLARAARHLLIPASARGTANPVEATAEGLADGLAHFADHCATCHGNNGKGETSYGRKMFPRVPDMTEQATQSLSDGELFWIIENGVRLTGMPGFGGGDPEAATESWTLVQFIRHLPSLSVDELAAMERLNPALSRADVEREREIEAFLAGEAPADEGPAGEAHHH